MPLVKESCARLEPFRVSNRLYHAGSVLHSEIQPLNVAGPLSKCYPRGNHWPRDRPMNICKNAGKGIRYCLRALRAEASRKGGVKQPLSLVEISRASNYS